MEKTISCPQGCHVSIKEGETTCPVCDESKRKTELPRMTDEELKQFVLDACDGHIFTNTMCNRPEDVSIVFMTIALFPPGLFYTKEAIQQVGIVWERMSEAGPRAVNGMPMFMSHRLMHIDDWKRAAKAIDAELERRDQVVV